MTTRSLFLVLFLIAAVLAPIAPEAAAQYSHKELLEMEKQVQNLIEKCRPSVVTVLGTSPGAQGSGTATIIDKDGLLLTAAHVIGRNKEMIVVFPDGTRGKAKSLGCHHVRDIALAQITEGGEGKGKYPFLELGDSKSVEVAEIFVAMGHAGGFDARRPAPARIGRSYNTGKAKFIMTDCTLIGGDSGGPLLTLDRKVVGVHSHIGGTLSQNSHAPVHSAQEVWERLMAGERWGSGFGAPKLPDRGTGGAALGVRFSEEGEDVAVTEVVENGPAAKAGIKKGDVVLRIGTKPTPDRTAFFDVFAGLKPGQKIKFAVKRGSKVEVIEVTLGKRGEVFEAPKEDEDKESKDEDKPKEKEPEEKKGNKKPSFLQWDDAMPVDLPKDFDEKKFAEFIKKKAVESGGKLQMNPAKFREALIEFGMPKADVDKMTDQEVVQLALRSMKHIGNVQQKQGEGGGDKPDPFGDPRKEGEGDKMDIDEGKFRSAIEKLVKENQGKQLQMNPAKVRKLLADAGVPKEKLDKVGDVDLMREFLQRLRAVQGGTGGLGKALRMTKADTQKLDEQFTALLAGHEPAVRDSRKSTVAFISPNKGLLSLGAVVDSRGFALTKASEVAKAEGSSLVCFITKERQVGAKVVKTWKDQDLALVRIGATDLPAIQWHQGEMPRVGAFLTSPGVDQEMPIAIGLLSVESRSLTNKNRGFLGIGVGEAEKGVSVTSVSPNSAASKAGLKTNDNILKLNGKEIEGITTFIAKVGAMKPGDKIRLDVKRGDKELSIEAKLGVRPAQGPRGDARFQRMNSMGTKPSDRATDFPNVFQHDLPLDASEVGGVIVDLKGKVLGLNIARGGRIKTFAIPSTDILDLLADVDYPQLVKANPMKAGAPNPKPNPDPATEPTTGGSNSKAISDLMAAIEQAKKSSKETREALGEAKDAAGKIK